MPDGANQIIADAVTRHAVDLLRVEAGERRKIVAILRELERDLVATLQRIDPTGVGERYRPARLAKMLEQVRGTIRASYRDASKVLSRELIELADIEAQFITRAINTGVGFGLADNELTREQLRSIGRGVLVQGSPVSEWLSDQAGQTLRAFTREMRMGIASGETNAQLVRRIRGGTENGEAVRGFMQVSRNHAESLVRSATQAVASEAKNEVYKANADILKGVAWSATLDNRTTFECGARDGLLYDAVTHEPIGHNLPWGGGPGNLHWGCRSTSYPVTKSFRELGIDVDEVPPGTRSSMDGQLPQDTRFEDWLERQSKARQEEVLGAGRAELWRDGKISFRDLLDQNGRPLTLEQLRERI